MAMGGLDRFMTKPVAEISCKIGVTFMFGVAQVRVEFGFQASFNHGFSQFFEQSTLAQDVLGGLILFEQLVNEFASNSHTVFLPGAESMKGIRNVAFSPTKIACSYARG